MSRYRTISPACLPMRCPFMATVVYYLLLDRLNAAGWVWGVVGTLLACVWAAWIIGLVKNDSQGLYGFGEIKEHKEPNP